MKRLSYISAADVRREDGVSTKAGKVYANARILNVFLVLCVCFDLYTMKSLWSQVMDLNGTFILLTALGCAVALDVLNALSGLVFKGLRPEVRVRVKAILQILEIAAFVTALVFSCRLRVAAGAVAFEAAESGAGETLGRIGSTVAGEGFGTTAHILSSVVFNAVIPLALSAM